MDMPEVKVPDVKVPSKVSHLPAGAMVVIAIVLLFVLFKVGKLVSRLILLAVIAALLYGAYWWHYLK